MKITFVKKFTSATVLISLLCLTSYTQKLSEPKLLGRWIGGEDPSEMLIHWVLERSAEYIKENPNGKLIVNICSPDEFSTAFMKSTLNPLSIKHFNLYDIFPNEKIFISRSAKCAGNTGFAYNQYWFVPEENAFEYDEFFSIDSIYFNGFYVFEFEEEEESVKQSMFEKNIDKFIDKLKDDPKLRGFIVHNSKSKKMKYNIEKVKNRLKKENINLQRIKILKALSTEFDVESEKVILLKNDKSSYPKLTTLKIKNQ